MIVLQRSAANGRVEEIQIAIECAGFISQALVLR